VEVRDPIWKAVMTVNHNKLNFTVHNRNTRQNMNLHLPSSKLTVYQKGTNYMAIKIYNSFPTQIKEIAHDPKQFRKNLNVSFI
jgi:hypothetical protein